MSNPSHPSMLPRFDGESGKLRLSEALKKQILISGDNTLAEAIAQKASLIEIMPPYSPIIAQGGVDNDIYFVISGSVRILINGREITKRYAGTHIGEMALIDSTARRSATIIPAEPCMLARVTEADFTTIAQQHPELWRRIAVELATRLYERNKYISEPHNQPVVFVGSSSEQLEIARQIQLGLSHDPVVVTVWTDGIFKASNTSIESLLSTVNKSDFAVLVISSDDLVESKGIDYYGPRDNVVFELGLFMGGIGRDRTFLVRPRRIDIKIPSDLFGVTPLDYEDGTMETIAARIAPVCTELRRIIFQAGPK